jgi:hypothetical protein
VPIPAALRDELYRDGHGPGRVFRSHQWACGAKSRAEQRWRVLGLPVVTFHEARHGYAALTIAAGVNAKALCTFMGHTRIKSPRTSTGT